MHITFALQVNIFQKYVQRKKYKDLYVFSTYKMVLAEPKILYFDLKNRTV